MMASVLMNSILTFAYALLDFLVERATQQAMVRLGDCDLEDIGYHLAQLTRYLGILCLTEGRADLCLAVLVAGE